MEDAIAKAVSLAEMCGVTAAELHSMMDLILKGDTDENLHDFELGKDIIDRIEKNAIHKVL